MQGQQLPPMQIVHKQARRQLSNSTLKLKICEPNATTI